MSEDARGSSVSGDHFSANSKADGIDRAYCSRLVVRRRRSANEYCTRG
jgi:hypothetical protein